MSEHADPAKLGYAEALDELEQIVAELERTEVDVDILNDRFARAVRLLEELDSRIGKARTQVKDLLPRLDGLAATSKLAEES